MRDLIIFSVFIGLIVLYICGLRAQDEREYQNERIRKGYRDDD
jgi:hypothetical protein